MKNKLLKTILYLLIITIIIGTNMSYASNDIAYSDMASQVQKYIETENIDINNITEEEVLDAYDQIADSYSKEEIIGLIEENEEKLKEHGVSDSTIEAGKTILETTDEEEVKQIIKENVDIKDIQEKIKEGYTPEEIVSSIINEMPTEQKITTAGRVILSSHIVKNVIYIIIALFIYCTIMRAIIYHKAGKNAIAAFIPFYRQVTMYRICDLSLGYMLLWLLPIVGWLCLIMLAIMKRIYLAKNFGKSAGFGIGLIILPPVFLTILALGGKSTR